MNFQADREGKNPGASEYIVVLFRTAEKRVGKIRVFSQACELDAGGLEVHWLTDVAAGESIDLLTTFIPAGEPEFRESRHMSETAVSAIALHADRSADSVLQRLAAPNQPEIVRRNVAFWLGNVRGQAGYEVLKRIVKEDPSDKVREEAVFALSLSPAREAVGAMIEAARNDKSTKVRGQALFWLSQKAGKRETDAIADAVTNDPETT